jgi:hypothetical protein
MNAGSERLAAKSMICLQQMVLEGEDDSGGGSPRPYVDALSESPDIGR